MAQYKKSRIFFRVEIPARFILKLFNFIFALNTDRTSIGFEKIMIYNCAAKVYLVAELVFVVVLSVVVSYCYVFLGL